MLFSVVKEIKLKQIFKQHLFFSFNLSLRVPDNSAPGLVMPEV